MRIITRKITLENKQNIYECLRLGGKVRLLNAPDLVSFMVQDAHEFILGVEDYKKREERLNLISSNKGLLSVFEQYFERLWKQAKNVK